MSPKVLKSFPLGQSQKYKFHDFEGEESDFMVFEGNTVNLVDLPPLAEKEPSRDFQPPPVDIETIIRKAERDAETICKNAREKAAQIEREAYEKGVAEGQKTGEMLAHQKLETVLARFHGSLGQLVALREVSLRELTLDIIDLVVFVAEKVLRAHIQTHPSALVEMVRDAVKSVKEKEQMIVFLNPQDFSFLTEDEAKVRSVGLGGSVKVEQDGQLSRGSIKIKTSYGDVDSTVETQLELIRKQVQKKLMEFK